MEDFHLDFYKYLAVIMVMIIGFFLRSLLSRFSQFSEKTTDSITQLNLSVEKLILQHDYSLDRIKKNEESINSMRNEIEIIKVTGCQAVKKQ